MMLTEVWVCWLQICDRFVVVIVVVVVVVLVVFVVVVNAVLVSGFLAPRTSEIFAPYCVRDGVFPF